MARILVIEDTDIQRQHAERELESHDLTFAATADEVEEMGQYDFVLTDLLLPESAGDEPDFEVGCNLLERAFNLFEEEKLKGVALVSNFEHHINVDALSRSIRSDLNDHFRDMGFFDFGRGVIKGPAHVRSISHYFDYMSEEYKKFEKDGSDTDPLLYILDATVTKYEYYLTESGEVISSEELARRVGSDDFSELCEALRGEFSIAKPWGGIVESLEYLQE